MRPDTCEMWNMLARITRADVRRGVWENLIPGTADHPSVPSFSAIVSNQRTGTGGTRAVRRPLGRELGCGLVAQRAAKE